MNIKEQEIIEKFISEASTTADYAKLSTKELKDLLSIFKNVGRSAAKPILRSISAELNSRLKENSEELEEAKVVPFKKLEQAWTRTNGDKAKQAKLIKKHDLKKLISSVRPGEIKLGIKNKLLGTTKAATAVGLDLDDELIFITNNPLKIIYPKKSTRRPEGEEIKESTVVKDVKTLRFEKIVSLTIKEDCEDIIESFISESNFEVDSTPAQIRTAYKTYSLSESAANLRKLKTSNKLSSAEYEKFSKLKAFNDKDWKWNSKESLYHRVNEETELKEASASDIKKVIAAAKKVGGKVKGNQIDFGMGAVIDVSIEKGKIKLDAGLSNGVEYFKNAKDAIMAFESVEELQEASFNDIEKVMKWADKYFKDKRVKRFPQLDTSKKYGTAFINLTAFNIIILRLGGKKGIVVTHDDRTSGKGKDYEEHFSNANDVIKFVQKIYDEMPKNESVEELQEASFNDIEKVMGWAKKNLSGAKLDISKKYGTAFINLTIMNVITLRLGGKKGIVVTHDDRTKGKGKDYEEHFSSANDVIKFVQKIYDEMPKEESVELEEAKIPSSNISKFSSPQTAKRAASKQKYKTQIFMGDDGMFWVPSTNKEAGQLKKDGYEVYESADLEEAYDSKMYYAKFKGRIEGPYKSEKEAYYDTKGDAEWIKKGKDIKESTELEEAIKVKTHRGMYSMKKGEESLRNWVDGIVIMSDAVKKNQRKTVAQNIVKAIETGKIKNADLTQDLGALIGIKSPKGMEAPANTVKAKLKDLGLNEAKNDTQKDIESLKKMIKNPDPKRVKSYGGTKYVDMLKSKLAKLQESTDLEEANNRLVAHSPAAAQRLIKKLKNKFSGYPWDQRIKGDEVIYPMEPHIIRFIKKQPEVATI